MVKYICDICKKEFLRSEDMEYIEIKVYVGNVLIRKIKVGDVCKDCIDALDDDVVDFTKALEERIKNREYYRTLKHMSK